ncbi:MAG TPA: HyaD/HybD family hydrogenase maturation endopeptidase [Terriglobales bacterium]|nr:HyaD/HybD family hydrogenase maturation endopeptidase [Terriglobales bacterium]
MHDWLPSETVVIGVGNTILSDDGLGVHAARRLQNDPRLPADVTILDGGTFGLELAPFVSDASRVLFLDAVDSGQAPGTLTRMAGRDLLAIPGSWSVHRLGVADLISTLALIATQPQDIVVLGVQPAHTDWGTTLSPEVKAALAPLVDAALKQLLLWQQIKADNMDMKASLTNPTAGPAITESADKGGN